MKFRNSLAIPIIGILIIVAFSTMFVGYCANIQVLSKALEAREEDKIDHTHSIINSIIKMEIKKLTILSNMLKDNKDLAGGLIYYYRSGGDFGPIKELMDRLYPELDSQIFLVTDLNGIVVYRANEPSLRGDDHNIWGMDEALAGEDIIQSSIGPHGWAIRTLAPLFKANKIWGVLILGTRVDDNFAKKIAGATNTQISFGTPLGNLASSLPLEQRSLIDPTIVERSILEEKPFVVKDNIYSRTFKYVPLPVVDETICLVIGTESAGIAALLKDKKGDLILLGLGIFIIVIILGSGLTFYLISPLKKLQARAQKEIKEFSGEDLSPQAHGNEIQTLSHAFDLMLATINQYIWGLRQAEEALRESEEKYRLLVNQIPAMVFQGYGDWSIDPLDEKVEALTGYSKADFEARRVKWCDLIPDEDLDYATRVFIKALKTDKSYVREHRLRKKNGEIIWVQCRGQIFCDDQGKVDYISGVSFDVTQRRQAEEAVREGERFLADIFASIQDGINVLDTDYNILRVNPTLERWYAHALPLVGKKCYAVFHGLREPCESCPYRQTLKTGKAAYKISPRKGKDGEEAGWIEIFTFPLTDMATGKVRGVVVYIRDFTERKQAEEALQERERFLTSIFASIQDGISVLDNEFDIVRVNPAMERAYAQAMPLAGKKCYEAYHGRREPCEICPTRSTLETGLAAREMVVEKGAGGEIVRYVDLHTFPLMDMSSGQMKGVVEYIRDVTEHKQAEEALRQSEEQLLQAQKMEAVGRLAGGVAHDFNNILTGITGYSELLLMSLKDQNPLRHDVEEIKNAAARAASLTRQLLAFSRKQMLQPQPLNLNAVVANMDKMLQRVIGEDIDLVTMLAPELGTVKADPGQMEQVIMNLAVNARDAMPRGGKLTIETADVHLDEDYARSHEEVHPGPYVMLAISDTGIGMDGEAQSRIFEPFYTTKEQGQGTGLGLSTVYGIVKQSGGHIWVYSEPGRGTTFKIYLPLMEGAGAAVTTPRSTPGKSFQGTETILLVEDEEMVRQVTRRILEKNGYTVLEAGRGQQALDINDQHPGTIQLLLTDVVMPGMSGRELVDRLIPQHPEMKVLYMSGHTENAIVHHGVLDPGVAFLQKPFRHEVLVGKVREVLDTPPPGPAKRSGPGPEATAGGPPGGG